MLKERTGRDGREMVEERVREGGTGRVKEEGKRSEGEAG